MNLTVLITGIIVFAIFAVPFYLVSRKTTTKDDAENTPAKPHETEQFMARLSNKKPARHS